MFGNDRLMLFFYALCSLLALFLSVAYASQGTVFGVSLGAMWGLTAIINGGNFGMRFLTSRRDT